MNWAQHSCHFSTLGFRDYLFLNTGNTVFAFGPGPCHCSLAFCVGGCLSVLLDAAVATAAIAESH